MATTFPVINLGQKKPVKGTIFLGPRPKSQHEKDFIRRNKRQKIANRSLKVAGVASIGLIPGGTLVKAGRVLIPKTIGGVAKVLLVGGVLASSAKARKAVREAPKTLFQSGQKLGRIIENPGRAEDILGIRKGSTLKEGLITGAKAAGIGGAAVAGVVGVKKLISNRKTSPTPQLAGLRDVGFISPQPATLAVPGLVPQQPALAGPLGPPVTQQPTKPVTNIIQIQVS